MCGEGGEKTIELVPKKDHIGKSLLDQLLLYFETIYIRSVHQGLEPEDSQSLSSPGEYGCG